MDDYIYVGYETLDNELIGFLRLKIINNWLLELEKFNVNQIYRRKGIGSKLLETAINKATDLKYGKISLLCREDNLAARSLYEKFGFIEEAFLEHHFDEFENMYVISKFLKERKK